MAGAAGSMGGMGHGAISGALTKKKTVKDVLKSRPKRKYTPGTQFKFGKNHRTYIKEPK